MLTTLLPQVGKIAVLRANSLGDLMFALPALQSIRHAYPNAELVYLGSEWHSKFLQSRPHIVDRAITIPQTEGVLLEAGRPILREEQDAFFAQMQAERFDIAFQMHGGGRYSNPFVNRLHARLTAGAKSPDAVATDRWIPYHFYQNEVIRNLEVASLAGVAPVTVEPSLPVGDDERDEARRAFANIDEKFVVIHPGASESRRHWPPSRYAAVADHLHRRGYQVVLTGTAPERTILDAVSAAATAPLIDLGGALSLNALAGLLSLADLVITNNTGPLHLALAVGAPAIGLYWCDNIVTTLPLTRRHFTPLISWDRHCPDCGIYCSKEELDTVSPDAPCRHKASLLTGIQVEEVITAIDERIRGDLPGRDG